MIVVNGEPLDVDARTITALLEALTIDTRGIAVARNGDVVPRSTWNEENVATGDHIEIVTAAAGG